LVDRRQPAPVGQRKAHDRSRRRARRTPGFGHVRVGDRDARGEGTRGLRYRLLGLDPASLGPPLRLAPITPEVAVESTRLPEPFHHDPVDRLLTATARVDGLTLMTRDRRILDYAAQGHVRALAC
jgi:predicted nucleic acid-binding protein